MPLQQKKCFSSSSDKLVLFIYIKMDVIINQSEAAINMCMTLNYNKMYFRISPGTTGAFWSGATSVRPADQSPGTGHGEHRQRGRGNGGPSGRAESAEHAVTEPVRQGHTQSAGMFVQTSLLTPRSKVWCLLVWLSTLSFVRLSVYPS